MANTYSFIPYERPDVGSDEMMTRARMFRAELDSRRSIRHFSGRPVPRQVIEDVIMTASTAPSGAHKQPWTFCAVSDPVIKSEIRKAAEKEEYESYNNRMTDEWLADLEPLGTDWHKPFIETVPWLIVVFKKAYDVIGGEKKKNYYVNESVGIAAGMLITAIHNAGLATLTHTPSPMNFLQKILDRPENERPFLLMPVGYPADDAMVPDIKRKPEEDVIVYFE